MANATIKRDLDKLYNAYDFNSFSKTLEAIVHVLREDVDLRSLTDLKEGLEQARFVKAFDENIFESLLDRLNLHEAQWSRIEEFSQKWRLLYDISFTKQSLVQGLMGDVCYFLNSKVYRFPKQIDSLWDFSLSFPDIHLNYFDEEIHMIIVSTSRAGPNEFSQIKEIIRKNDATSKITLVLVVGDGNIFRDLAQSASFEIVVLDSKDWKSIIMSTNSRQMFCRRVAGRVSVEALQPYQTQGKVRSRMFYGRQDELKRLKNNLSSSFAIYGGRLIGKTSFLQQIKEEFENDESNGFQICSITAQGYKERVEVCRAILKILDIPTGTHSSITTFERLMRKKLTSSSKKVLILIDEIDELIEVDEKMGNQLFEVFHNLNNDYGENCRFVFAGYRDLARHCMDRNSRFFNFAEKILLGDLDPLNARLLIREPLCDELGFTFESDELVEKILYMTGGHPNYIQVFCKNLSEYLDKRRTRRIREEDVEYTFQNPDFRKQVIRAFYMNFSPMQRIVTALVILDEKTSFTLPEAAEYLMDYGLDVDISDIYALLNQLEMSFVLEQRDRVYQFNHKLFPEMLKMSEDLNALVYMELRKLGV